MTTSLNLSNILTDARATLESPGPTAGHLDPARHKSITPKLFFKKLRPSGSGFEYHDLLCELFCSRLARQFHLPIPACMAVTMPGDGLGLVSAFAGQKMLSGSPLESIINADKLPASFVFEQLVVNVDDKADHFRLKDLPEGKGEVAIVDHGHTLHAWRPDFQNPDTIELAPALLLPSSGMNEYRIQNFSQLEHLVKDLSYRAPEFTQKILDEVFTELEETGDIGCQRFLAERSRHEAIINKIVRVRAKNLSQIIRLKCQLSGIKLDPEETIVSLIGPGISH